MMKTFTEFSSHYYIICVQISLYQDHCSKKQSEENKHTVCSTDNIFQWSAISVSGVLINTVWVTIHSGQFNYAYSYPLYKF